MRSVFFRIRSKSMAYIRMKSQTSFAKSQPKLEFMDLKPWTWTHRPTDPESATVFRTFPDEKWGSLNHIVLQSESVSIQIAHTLKKLLPIKGIICNYSISIRTTTFPSGYAWLFHITNHGLGLWITHYGSNWIQHNVMRNITSPLMNSGRISTVSFIW